jgi:prophage regulatory protein
MRIHMTDDTGGVRLLRGKQILEMFGISHSTLYQWMSQGRFPKPIELGPNTRAWLTDEVDAFIVARAKERKR